MRRARRTAAWVLAGLLAAPAAGFAFPAGRDDARPEGAKTHVRLVDEDDYGGGRHRYRADRDGYWHYHAPYREGRRYERRFRDYDRRDRGEEDEDVVAASVNWGNAPGR